MRKTYKLHHVAFWSKDIARSLKFYRKHFAAKELFSHQDGEFRCTFISINGCVRIELMNRSKLVNKYNPQAVGYSQLSLDVGSREEVDRLSNYFKAQGIRFEKQQIQYDDGFYESSIFDPDGNIIELAYIDEAANPQALQI